MPNETPKLFDDEVKVTTKSKTNKPEKSGEAYSDEEIELILRKPSLNSEMTLLAKTLGRSENAIRRIWYTGHMSDGRFKVEVTKPTAYHIQIRKVAKKIGLMALVFNPDSKKADEQIENVANLLVEMGTSLKGQTKKNS